MIKKQDLLDHFWEEGNMITSEHGVELAMHGDTIIEVSVLLRNELEISESSFYRKKALGKWKTKLINGVEHYSKRSLYS